MIYLDNAATTLPLDKALEKYIDVSKNAFGNSSSMHTAGLDAVNALETARTSVASLLACDKSEVYFTSGGTESDNIAIFGTVRRLNRRGKKIITCAYEHAAVENCMKELEKHCGYPILERTYRGVRLTKNGEKVVKLAEQILTLCEEITLLPLEPVQKKEKSSLIISQETLKLLSSKIVGPASKVMDFFTIEEGRSSEQIEEAIQNNAIALLILTDEKRQRIQHNKGIVYIELYKSKLHKPYYKRRVGKNDRFQHRLFPQAFFGKFQYVAPGVYSYAQNPQGKRTFSQRLRKHLKRCAFSRIFLNLRFFQDLQEIRRYFPK